MRELSIEQKAKAYDEAFERAKEWYNPTEADLYTCIAESIFPELKESEDEKIRIELIHYFTEGIEFLSFCSVSREQILTWLEKQGEQKLADKVEPKFNFNVGQWIVATGKCVYLITKIDGFNVTLVDVHGDEFVFDTSSLDDAHLWTIQDAKDGDVLSDGITTIFIFKDLLSDGSVLSYCDYDADSGENDAFCPLSMNLVCSKITPATQEQRDLLFSKMKEAGYEWNTEKKEVKKIEQEPAWSEEDADYIKDLISHFSQNEKLENTKEDVIAWLKSLKDRVHHKVE